MPLRRFLGSAALIGALVTAACGGSGADSARPAPSSSTAAPAPAPATAIPAADARPRIVILGDSLTAGLGLPLEDAYPSLLQQKLDAERLPYQVVNAGVSGDTSAGGLSRLEWSIDGDVRVLVVALGGNDGLRGLPPAELARNLSTIIERAQARGLRVILAGMEAPPNFGQGYVVSFHQVYPDLAAKYRVPLIPFLLQNVAGIDRLNQNDGIHPTAEGARLVADNIWPVLRAQLQTS